MLEARPRDGMMLSGEPRRLKPSLSSSQSLFGTRLSPMTTPHLLDTLERQIASREQCIVAYQNMHGMHLSYTDEAFYALHQRANSLVFIDGFPIYALCKLLGYPVQREQRITGNDFIWPLLSLAERKEWRVYFLGSSQSVVTDASAVIRSKVPSLSFRAHHGFFDPDTEGVDVIREIVDFDPHLVIVCMGMPVQERWIQNNAGGLEKTSICAMGAILEYIAGAQPIPPRWLGPLGLEWLYRLARNPKRLWYRYLIEPWLLAGHVLRARMRAQKTRL